MKPANPEDTIAAVSTPPGEGAVAIVRLSGGRAVELVERMFVSSLGRSLRDGARRVFHGEIRDPGGAAIDEVLVHVMRAPHSYTREDVVEINCHGGAAPVEAVLALALEYGARLAEPGEFTRRAFLNGRIDLVQAEAVIDRIRARTRAALRAAHAAASGALSTAIHDMRGTLAAALARVEAAVDFPEDDLPELVDEPLRRSIEDTLARMRALLHTAETGRLYREGAAVTIVGRPNVGKSSLFNALLRDARAIVTAHPGTTRDLIEETISIEGVPVRLRDTAGLRAADSEAEQLGVEAARNALRAADVALLVIDADAGPHPDDAPLARELETLEVPVLIAVNKSDLAPDTPLPSWASAARAVCRVSARTGHGLAELEQALGAALLAGHAAPTDLGLINRVHQRDSLRRAAAALERLLEGFGASPEFLSIELRDALNALGEITGETTTEDILDRIFSTFCIGK